MRCTGVFVSSSTLLHPKVWVSVELSTLGGDPEVARMMGEDIRFRSEVNPDWRIVFLGKAAIYSAGPY